MNEKRRGRGEVTSRGERRRRAASRRGAASVRDAFGDALTRRVFAAQVGIHLTTVRRWEALGIVKPELRTVLRIPTLIFSEGDVLLGQAIVELLRSNRGTMSLEQAAAIARGTSQRPRDRGDASRIA